MNHLLRFRTWNKEIQLILILRLNQITCHWAFMNVVWLLCYHSYIKQRLCDTLGKEKPDNNNLFGDICYKKISGIFYLTYFYLQKQRTIHIEEKQSPHFTFQIDFIKKRQVFWFANSCFPNSSYNKPHIKTATLFLLIYVENIFSIFLFLFCFNLDFTFTLLKNKK